MRYTTRKKNPREFRKKFAWYPVRISSTWIWLEYYEKTNWYWDENDNDYHYITRLISK